MPQGLYFCWCVTIQSTNRWPRVAATGLVLLTQISLRIEHQTAYENLFLPYPLPLRLFFS